MSRNQDSGMPGPVAFVMVGIVLIGMFLFALAAFVTLLLTIACLCAWNRPVTIGKWTIEPDEARAFVRRGLIGLVALPAFAIFTCLLFNLQMNDSGFGYIAPAGYVLGSLGVSTLEAMHKEKEEQEAAAHPVQPQLIPPPRAPAPRRPAEEFRFASWDDEEDKE